MGGTIDVETADGEGSTFTLQVSFARAAAPAAASVAPVAARRLAGALRVILAEDNPVNQIVQLRMLRQLGYDADVAVSGVELLDSFRKSYYDVVLLDVQMPVMDGIQAARELRRRGFRRARLIALTADVTSETRRACRDAGIDEFLSKPVQIDALADVLSRVESQTTAHPA
jgi:CheY-like chemotaxis protein